MKKLALSCACATLLLSSLVGCRSGPMEKAGGAVDDAADDVADVFRK